MKIVLVSPVSKAGNGGFILGLAYISAMLKRHGFVHICGIDLMYQPEGMLDRAAAQADFIGFYATTRTIDEVARLARRVSNMNPRSTIAVGGPHATLFPHEVIEMEGVDVVGVGEGEFTVLELVQAIAGGKKDFENIEGIYWKKDSQTIVNPARKTCWKLDDLPFPDWELFDHGNYYTGLATPIASRGCPFRCANCMPALKTIAGPFRMRSVANVVAELKYLNSRYGFDHFFFQDNDMAVNPRWLASLCNAIEAEEMNIQWHGLCRVNRLTRLLLKTMQQSGCSHVNIGAECGSQRVIDDVLKKDIELKQVQNVVSWCNELGLESTVFFMIGIPGESLTEMHETIRFAASLKADDLMFSVSQPVPHSEFERVCRKNGWLLTSDPGDLDTPDPNGGMRCWIETDTWKPTDLIGIKQQMRRELGKRGYEEIDNRLLFRNFGRILQKRDWAYVGLMIREEIRKTLKQRRLRPLKWGGYYLMKKLSARGARHG